MTTIRPGQNSISSDELLYNNLDQRLMVTSLVLGTLACLAALITGGPGLAGSFMAGATLSYLNFNWLKQAVNHLVQSAQPSGTRLRRSTRITIFKYFLRYALIGLFLYVIFRFQLLEMAGFLSGLFLYVAAVLTECLSQVVRTLVKGRNHGAREHLDC